MKKVLLYLSISAIPCLAIAGPSPRDTVAQTILQPAKRLNIIISPHIRKIEAAPVSFQIQASWRRLFHRKKLYAFYVDSVAEAAKRITNLMQKQNAMIGNLWFDSHGHLGRRVSIIEIGNDEVSTQTMYETNIRESLKKIGAYCDTATKIGLGSCYSAATFTVAAIDKFPEQRMNGDSLMIFMSEVMNGATVYGSRSWVMTKPGIFSRSYALAGSPGDKRFKDPFFQVPWQELGMWNAYDHVSKRFRDVNTIGMDNAGNIKPLQSDYLDDPRHVKRQQKKMKKIRPGNFELKWFYKYQYPRQHSR